MANWIARLAGRRPGSASLPATPAAGNEAEWRRIAELTVEGFAGKRELRLDPTNCFRMIKLRSRSVSVEVFRWTLQFDDGAIQELSVNCLFEGAESRPILIAGRRLKGMLVEYDAPKSTRRGQLEIWAQP